MFISILWHFHQPVYKKPGTTEYILPWVNFHAVKNYYQMARLVEEADFPCTFNFVPCLLEQIQDYAQGRAIDSYQQALEKDQDRLAQSEIELLRKFSPHENDPGQIQLQALRSFFSPFNIIEKDKADLLCLQKEIHRNLLSYYKNLCKEGKIELLTSPYYHPLLPLVSDLASAQGGNLPGLSFRHPEDAEEQLRKGKEYFQNIFGSFPTGLWPPEAGISQEVARLTSRLGFSFIITDENILWKSLKHPYSLKDLSFPYASDDLSVFFRDRELSDLLGFEYQKWNEKVAVDDFLRRLEERKKSYDENSIVVIALDGENPWASYRLNGMPFLREFFSRLKEKEKHGLYPIFFKDYLTRYKPKKEIILVPGTWLGNFSKWIGSPAKNETWKMLIKARELCGPKDEIYVAEGSDWFWWSGEENTEEFQFIFKSYIREAYQLSGIDFQ